MAMPMLRLRFSVDGEEHLFPLESGRVRLGRGSDNEVVLSDVSVSRNHAEIHRLPDGQWTVRDLRSTNGVEINHVPVESAPLHDGDHITIGSFEISVEAIEVPRPEPPAPSPSGLNALAGLGNATIVRPLADIAAALAASGASIIPNLPVAAETKEATSTHRMLGFLIRLARILLDAATVDDVLQRVLEISFESLPVDRGFILLSNEETGDLACEISRVKERIQLRPKDEVPVSRTMLRAVMRERVALVTFDAQADQRLSGGESIRLHQIRAAMCTPLWSGDRIIGVIQVDSPFQVGAFGELELDFLTTIANYAAVAIERIQYADKAQFERQIRSRLERYHSPALIEEVLRQEGAEGEAIHRLRSAEASVLFADLVGFTAFSESASPEQVAELLNGFLNLSVEAIFRAGGTLDKFIGDCVMAFFGAPVPQVDHALRAVQAAIEIQSALKTWNAERERQGLPRFGARVAINSGPVVVGDVGSERRVDYTVLGNTVNVAARLENFVAKPGDVVMGPETHRLLGDVIATERLGEFQLKNLKRKIAAYRVVTGVTAA
jgi:adenylate cyclase